MPLPRHILKGEIGEAHARLVEFLKGMRCLVCQNPDMLNQEAKDECWDKHMTLCPNFHPDGFGVKGHSQRACHMCIHMENHPDCPTANPYICKAAYKKLLRQKKPSVWPPANATSIFLYHLTKALDAEIRDTIMECEARPGAQEQSGSTQCGRDTIYEMQSIFCERKT